MSRRISRRHFLARSSTFASFIAFGGLSNLAPSLAAKAVAKWDAKMELEVGCMSTLPCSA